MILVGQQDRRQLAYEPFLTGRSLEKMAGDYPVWSSLPVRAQDVPGAIARAYNEAQAARGPALVVIPMGDWLQEADELAASRSADRGSTVHAGAVHAGTVHAGAAGAGGRRLERVTGSSQARLGGRPCR